jgi:hypothetical protein
MSYSHLLFGLPSGLLNIGFYLCTFLPFFVMAFDVNDQTNLIFVLLCNLLSSYVLLVYLINFIYWGFFTKSFDEFKNVRKIIEPLSKVLLIFMLLSLCLQCKCDKTREAEEPFFDMNIIWRHKDAG